MKYLEQRVEELELEVKLLKAKNKLEETTGFVNKHPIRVKNNDTSCCLNNYPSSENPNIHDYMYNHSNMTLLSEPELETSFASPYDYFERIKCPLNSIVTSLSSILDDTLPNTDYVDSSDLPQCYPPYPDVIGSYDNFDWNTMKDWASFNQTDEIPPYPGHKEISEISLERLNKIEKTIEKDFGKIISKFKILTHEWEMDGYGYIVSDLEYNKHAIVTNHGKPMVVNKSYLNDIIAGYKERIQETQRALFLINE
jgi:hypothetical protein